MSLEQSQHIMRIGVLLAAGRGGRMGQTKQLLPWRTTEGDKPMVAATFDAIADVCDDMVVVLGHDAQAVGHALEPRSFHPVHSSASVPMFESIRTGLEEAQRINAAANVLLQPADHPQVQPQTLKILIEAHAQQPDRAVMPTYDQRGGHPVLIPANMIDRILAYSGEGGLRQYWLDCPEACDRMAVDDPGVAADMDTPEQYEKGISH